ncbi:relaxase/mobilization nuclease domain-containing protein [Pseudoclavibacter sp. RFBG4]|uniref:relaxase/mobilization nuclease domain-containing protein n=1 Tax=Pseudoclavibacter sp. RFBG4 TaxID=2080575 RepID=UPI002157B4B2|nr:relaxase/mobilization nuclease domain-containing protein [Pseudoclavibacter sp. RFBG4]
MSGLMAYLVGPGRSNEHEEPHLVAGDNSLMAWYDDAELSRESAMQIAHYLDQPRQVYETEVNGGHVWHASLSLRADEREVTDAEWGQIAEEFVREMGFDDHEGTKAPCRWVAIRHGVSTNGNDHIHIAVNLVCEDGTKAPIHNDYYRAQQVARALETKHGLEELESMRQERATRGYDPAEREAQARSRARARHERERTNGDPKSPGWEALSGDDRRTKIAAELRTDQPRYLLSLRVRGAAAASQDEGEFVRRMRRVGLLVRPRFADGRTDVVTGYSVAARPTYGERPIWYGGGQLGRDLTLPRLRAEWPDTPTGASDAAKEWEAAYRGRRAVSPGRETLEIDPEMWERQSKELAETVERLQRVPVEDRETWARVSRHAAGVMSAWSNATEKTPGHLAVAAEALSRSAQTYRRPEREPKVNMQALAGTATLVAAAARGGQGIVAQTAMMRQMLRLTGALCDAAEAQGQLKLTQRLESDTRKRIETFGARLQAGAKKAQAETQESPARTFASEKARIAYEHAQIGQAHPPGDAGRSPLPNTLEQPTRTHEPTPQADTGVER